MNQSVINLVNAIKTGDALATEQAFSDAMADKIGAAIDARRQEIASNMFNTQEEVVEEEMIISEEEYDALSEEEKTEYELIEEGDDWNPYGQIKDKVGKSPKTYHGAVKSYVLHSGNKNNRYDADAKQVASARKNMKKAKKYIKKSGGDMKKVEKIANDFTSKHNEVG